MMSPSVPMPPLFRAPTVEVVVSKVVVVVVAKVLPVLLLIGGVIAVEIRLISKRLGRLGREGSLWSKSSLQKFLSLG